VPSYDFEVDLQALGGAARGIAETVQLFRERDVEDLVPTEAAVGHAAVWSALEEFKDRWERGMNNLVRDVEEMAGRLGRITLNYAEFDQQGRDTMLAARAGVAEVKLAPR
jgi:adenine-specific DNA methylase